MSLTTCKIFYCCISGIHLDATTANSKEFYQAIIQLLDKQCTVPFFLQGSFNNATKVRILSGSHAAEFDHSLEACFENKNPLLSKYYHLHAGFDSALYAVNSLLMGNIKWSDLIPGKLLKEVSNGKNQDKKRKSTIAVCFVGLGISLTYAYYCYKLGSLTGVAISSGVSLTLIVVIVCMIWKLKNDPSPDNSSTDEKIQKGLDDIRQMLELRQIESKKGKRKNKDPKSLTEVPDIYISPNEEETSNNIFRLYKNIIIERRKIDFLIYVTDDLDLENKNRKIDILQDDFKSFYREMINAIRSQNDKIPSTTFLSKELNKSVSTNTILTTDINKKIKFDWGDKEYLLKKKLLNSFSLN